MVDGTTTHPAHPTQPHAVGQRDRGSTSHDHGSTSADQGSTSHDQGSTSADQGSTSADQGSISADSQTGLAPVRGDGPGRDGGATRAAGQPQERASYCSVTVVDLPGVGGHDRDLTGLDGGPAGGERLVGVLPRLDAVDGPGAERRVEAHREGRVVVVLRADRDVDLAGEAAGLGRHGDGRARGGAVAHGERERRRRGAGRADVVREDEVAPDHVHARRLDDGLVEVPLDPDGLVVARAVVVGDEDPGGQPRLLADVDALLELLGALDGDAALRALRPHVHLGLGDEAVGRVGAVDGERLDVGLGDHGGRDRLPRELDGTAAPARVHDVERRGKLWHLARDGPQDHGARHGVDGVAVDAPPQDAGACAAGLHARDPDPQVAGLDGLELQVVVRVALERVRVRGALGQGDGRPVGAVLRVLDRVGVRTRHARPTVVVVPVDVGRRDQHGRLPRVPDPRGVLRARAVRGLPPRAPAVARTGVRARGRRGLVDPERVLPGGGPARRGSVASVPNSADVAFSVSSTSTSRSVVSSPSDAVSRKVYTPGPCPSPSW